MKAKETDYSPAIKRIQLHYDLLSSQERSVADYVIQNLDKILEMSVFEIATEVGVSNSTIVRFCRSIGFDGITGFRSYLKKSEFPLSEQVMPLDPDDSITAIANKAYAYNMNAIKETLLVLNKDALEQAVNALSEANKVLFITAGGSFGSSLCFYDALLYLGIECISVSDPFFQAINSKLIKPGDVAFGVSYSGRNHSIVENMKVAREAGARTISIVGFVGSPLTKHLDIALYTGMSEQLFFNESITARLCELYVMSILYSGILLRRSRDDKDFYNKHNKMMDFVQKAAFEKNRKEE